MKISLLWLAHRDPLHRRAGGAERTISEIGSRLSNLKYDVTVLSTSWKGCKDTTLFRGFKIRRFGNSLFLHLYIPLYILKNKPDIVVNDLGHAVPWISSILLRKKNVVFFRHLHARSLPGQVSKILALFITALEKSYFLYYHNCKFITESTTSVSDLIGIGIGSSNIMRITPGVDTSFYGESKKSEDPILVYFGGLRKYKRPKEVVRIFKEIHEKVPEVRLIIIGSGPELDDVKSLVKTIGLQSSVTFTGRISDKSLASIISKSWVNLHTSQTEGWGYSILEASASHTPTVAYSVPGVVDGIRDNVNGFKIKDNDRTAFAKAVIEVLKNPKPFWESSCTFAEKYSWDDTARMWDDTIQKILSTKRKIR